VHAIAILNTTIATTDGTYSLRTVTLDEARALVAGQPLRSYVGHADTVALLGA
jgi:hypothetical protein